MPSKSGSGLFAAAVARPFPLLPLEEEGGLNDPAIRENFIEGVLCPLEGTAASGALVAHAGEGARLGS